MNFEPSVINLEMTHVNEFKKSNKLERLAEVMQELYQVFQLNML
jgi:hypothetical protein